MKRKKDKKDNQTNSSSLFAGCVFVVSKTNPNRDELIATILKNGGKVVDKISKNITYFVQDYDVDDDGRLATVKKYNGMVVSPSFLSRCEAANRVLGFHEYAIGAPQAEKPKKLKTDKKLKSKADETDQETNNQKAFTLPPNIYDDLFREIRQSDREDEEFPQTFEDFLNMPDKNKPTNVKKYIYVRPLGFEPKNNKREYKGISLDIVEEFLQIFFGVPTKILPHWDIKQTKKKAQIQVGKTSYTISTDDQHRLQVMDILEAMWDHIPKDACCVVGLTLHDIFECESDENQFWGRATGDGCAVISLHRFNPAFFEPVDEARNKILSLSRSLNTIVHEIMHVFGIDHCVFYKCNMNSSEPIVTNIDETLHLCPIDLRKLQHTFQFEVVPRYEKLLAFYSKYEFAYESQWVTKRLQALT